MAQLTFSLSGDVVVTVNITEIVGGDLQFDLAVTSETGSIGDLNGLFFDIADESLLPGLAVAGPDVTGVIFEANEVAKVDNYNNIRGELLKDLGLFDGGIQFGTAGMAEDDIRETSFVLSHDTADLTVDQFLAMDFAARLTSVGPEGGDRGGSSKIGGKAPDTADDTGDGGGGDSGGGGGGDSGDGGGGGDPTNIANDDTMTASNEQGFNPGFPDPLDDFVFSILENDTTEAGDPYMGAITGAGGQSFSDGMIVAGSNGGLLMVFEDGTVDFSANGEFDYLTGTETAFTEFVYTIEGGDDAIITVEVFDFDGGGDGEIGLIGLGGTDGGIG